MRFSSGIVVAGLIAGCASVAHAADTDGWYVGAETGLNVAEKEKFNDNVGNTWADKHDLGFGILGQVGYETGPFRVEGELGFRSNQVKLSEMSQGTVNAGGSMQPLDFGVNGYYDFKNESPWTPYVGVGVGGTDLSANNLGTGGKIYINNSDFVVSYQGIAGVSYAIDDNLSIKADYRYFYAPEAHIAETSALNNATANTNYAAHSFLVGFTYKFGGASKPIPTPVADVAPPPAPPPPPPAPVKPVQVAPIAKNFQVFFDFDKSAITADAERIITDAADTAKTAKTTSIQLIGHTDSSGSDAYNMKLSIRRAEAVKAALVKLGIPANEIGVVGKGKADQLVPTKDGVREPQNRRVQIELQ